MSTMLAAGLVVEVAGRLVGAEDPRSVDEGSGQGDALLLAAGELQRVVVEPLAEADLPQQLRRFAGAAAFSAELQRHQHVLDRGQRRDQLEALEDEADQLVAQGGAGVLVHRFQGVAVEEHRAGSRVVEPGAKAEQGGLAAARGPDDRAAVAFIEGQRHIAQHGQLVAGVAMDLAQVADFEDRPFDSVRRGI